MDALKFQVTATAADRKDQPGSFAYFQEITTGSSTSRIQVTTNNGDRALLKQGQGVNLPAFKSLSVERESGSATIAGELLVGDGDFTDNRIAGNVSASPVAIDYTPATKTAGAASTQVLAANSVRKYLLIQNQSGTEDVYIKTNGTAATVDGNSLKLAPGAVWEPTPPPAGEIRSIRGAAVDATMHVIEG